MKKFIPKTLTAYIDWMTWRKAYRLGYYEPRHPVPSIYCISLISTKVDQRACDIAIYDYWLWNFYK
jgi:hypothetical protein